MARKHPANKPTLSRGAALLKQTALRRSRFGFRVAHHRHSGHRLPWHYTSYAVLYFLIVLTSMLVLFVSNYAKADEQTVQGAIVIGGTVNGPPPDTAAVITKPKNNERVSESIAQVEGQCTQSLFIELQRNNAFAGLTTCDENDSFALAITLTPGENRLVARIKDGAGQYGPDSATVTVFYDVPVSSAPVNNEAAPAKKIPPLLVSTDLSPIGLFVGKKFKLNYKIDGGQPPYAVSINWGDGSRESVHVHETSGDFTAAHTYKKVGQFTVSISVSDNRGAKAFIQTIIILVGAEDAPAVTAAACNYKASCIVSSQFIDLINRYIWPALLIALLMTFSFWLGERLVYTDLHRAKRNTI